MMKDFLLRFILFYFHIHCFVELTPATGSEITLSPLDRELVMIGEEMKFVHDPIGYLMRKLGMERLDHKSELGMERLNHKSELDMERLDHKREISDKDQQIVSLKVEKEILQQKNDEWEIPVKFRGALY